MPVLDDSNEMALPLDDHAELRGLTEKQKVKLEVQCRYCDIFYELTVPADMKIKYWKCIHCHSRNAWYL